MQQIDYMDSDTRKRMQEFFEYNGNHEDMLKKMDTRLAEIQETKHVVYVERKHVSARQMRKIRKAERRK